jgi:hypothetical protein
VTHRSVELNQLREAAQPNALLLNSPAASAQGAAQALLVIALNQKAAALAQARGRANHHLCKDTGTQMRLKSKNTKLLRAPKCCPGLVHRFASLLNCSQLMASCQSAAPQAGCPHWLL